jgi:hypothetical protein
MNFFQFFYRTSTLKKGSIIRKLGPRKISLLNGKYVEIKRIVENMTLFNSVLRQSCEQILAEKSLWSLSLSELMNDNMRTYHENDSIEVSFHSYFIQTKLEFYQNSKIPSNKCIIF